MRKAAITTAIIVAAALGATALIGSGIDEKPIAKGALSDALLASASDESALTSIFSRFLPRDMSLEERLLVLETNGFRCRMEAANVEGSRYLSCLRPTEGTGYCKGINYYSYETAGGEIIESMGSAFDASRRTNFLGQCDSARDEYRDGPIVSMTSP